MAKVRFGGGATRVEGGGCNVEQDGWQGLLPS